MRIAERIGFHWRVGLASAAVLLGSATVPLGWGVAVASPASAVSVRIDGSFEDWPAGARLLADASWFYVSVDLAELDSLQAGTRVRSLLIDVDGDGSTGRGMTVGGERMGVDIEVMFSPPRSGVVTDAPGNGVRVRLFGEDGSVIESSHAEIDMQFGPTYASDRYELRFSRHSEAHSPLAGRLTRSASFATAFVEHSFDGDQEERVSTARIAVPARGIDGRSGHDAEIPARPAGAVRVMSYNVLFAGPMTNPAPFARMISAADPDVILVQEWDTRNSNPAFGASDIEGWFNEHMPLGDDQRWSALDSDGWGVAIISKRPIERVGPRRVTRSGGDNEADLALRFVGGVTESPAGAIAVACVHYKCCGGASGSEERTRVREASTVNKLMLNDLSGPDTPRLRLVIGDFNLVGTREPLHATGRRLDADESDLSPVEFRVLGDGSAYTWREDRSRFTPGRLDWGLYSDSSARVVNAFSMDTRRLSAKSLEMFGLLADDSEASDHIPLVVDLLPRR